MKRRGGERLSQTCISRNFTRRLVCTKAGMQSTDHRERETRALSCEKSTPFDARNRQMSTVPNDAA